ncbi:MAG: hypothetical protein K8S99_09200 [Planctomycetes bacterium]|nr:hypothetical protein [Planctomycetota bacterium]
MRRTILRLLMTAAAVAWAGDGKALYAQNAMGDGRVLDRNLQVGSGGVNPQAAPRTPSIGNSIVTGNVSGLGYFHGNAGYRAPGELQVNLPSQSLFRFQAQSINPGQVAGVSWRPAGGGPAVLYRGYATPMGPAYQQGSGTRIVIPTSGVQVSVPRPEAPGFETPNPDRTIGVSVQPDGRMLELRSSPLMGLHVERRDTTTAAAQGPSTNRIEPVRIGTARGTSDLYRVTPPTAGLLDSGLARPAAVAPQSASGPMLSLDERVKQLQAAVFNPQGSTTATPGDDVYLDMLNKMREARDAASGRFRAKTPPTVPGTKSAQVVPPPPTEAAGATQLMSPEEQARADTEARRAAYGLKPEGAEETPEEKAAREKMQGIIERGDQELLAISDLLDEFKKRMPPLPSLASKRDDRVSVLMRQAEKMITEAKYLDAEQAYRAVLGWTPNHPLARVGLVHAQIGAGMLRSADLNLRALLNDNPMLIAVRYDRKLLPTEERLRWVRTQIDDMMAGRDEQRPAILLAYLGYQSREPNLTRYALDIAQAASPRDPLITLLRRLWLNSDDSGAPDPILEPRK